MTERLTKLRRQTLEFIAEFIDRHHYPPTINEIALYWGGISSNAVNDRLTALERLGFIERRPKLARGLVLTERGRAETRRQPSRTETTIACTSASITGQCTCSAVPPGDDDHGN